jgi:hypothetical protein
VLTRRRFPAGEPPAFAPPHGPLGLWRSPAFEPSPPAGSGPERLRRFHAHYGEDVLALARAGNAPAARAAMERWIAANPPRPGDAWHPYPTSTRVGSWIAALALAPDAGTRQVETSLWQQLRHLVLNVEDDVLGNHVIRNARALVLGGAAFRDGELLERGAALLGRELPEQVLPDGGHYERSPVYHLVVLRDLLEVDAAAPGLVPAATLERMRRFAAALARPDGVPSLFNDGALDLAPQLELPVEADGLALFPESGYAVVRRGPLWLAFDCGPFAPPFLPPHAHADALSFQLWWEGRPAVIDPGTSTYEPGADRQRERGTAAHSTVALDGRDQFALWGAFRAGPFPAVELLETTQETLAARVRWHDGAVHTRRIAIGGDSVEVADELSGAGRRTVVSSLPLAGEPDGVEAVGALHLSRESRPAAERLYVRESRPALVQTGSVTLPATCGWRLARPR